MNRSPSRFAALAVAAALASGVLAGPAIATSASTASGSSGTADPRPEAAGSGATQSASRAPSGLCDPDAAPLGEAGVAGACPFIVEVARRANVHAVTRDLPASAVTHRYSAALHGFAAWLNASQVSALRHNPNVVSVTPDMIITAADSQLGPPWGLDRIDSRSLPLSGTYDYVPDGGAGVTAYVVDTGIRATHVDFGGRVQPGASFVPDANGTNDCHGHGTHVAATIGGATYGVAKAVTLVPVRMLDCAGSGNTSGAIAALDWVIANHPSGQPAVANLSLGGAYSATLNTAIGNTVADGVVVVAAAGNDNADACSKSPASAPQALTVGATDSTDRRASFSNFGSCLDLFAPGVGVRSAGIASDTATTTMNGTSMAAPHVAGIAAVVHGLNPTGNPVTVGAAILADATPGVLANIGTGSPNLLAHAIDRPGLTTILTAPTSPTGTAGLTYALAFGVPVTDLDAADFTVTGTATDCVVGTPAGSGATYTVGVAGCSDGTVVLTLQPGSVTDTGGVRGPLGSVTASTVTIDRTAPTVALSAPNSPTGSASLTFALAFEEPVRGLAAGDFTLAGTATDCIVRAPTGSVAAYTVVVAGCSEGTVALTLEADTVTDVAGNAGPVVSVTSSTVTIERTPPTGTVVINGGNELTGSVWVTVHVEATDEGSGLDCAYLSNDGITWVCRGRDVFDYEFDISSNGGSAAGGSHHVYYKFEDNAGNQSAPVTVWLTLDTRPPAGSVAIAGGAAVVNVLAVTVDVPATGVVGGVTKVRLSNDGASWTTFDYAASVPWTLADLDGTRTVWVAWQGAGGTWSDAVTDTVVLDRTPPTTPSLSAAPQAGAALAGTAVPLAATWTAAGDAGSGVAGYELERSANGGTWTPAGTYAARSASVTAASSGTVRYRVRAVDKADNKGAWAYTATLSPRLVQQTSTAVGYGGTWSKGSSTKYSGGSTKYAMVAGRSATYRFTGRSIALVTSKAPSRGKVKVYVNGVYQGTVDLYRRTTQYRSVAWQKTWSTSGTRTIKLVVVGTSGRPRVDLDAFVVLR